MDAPTTVPSPDPITAPVQQLPIQQVTAPNLTQAPVQPPPVQRQPETFRQGFARNFRGETYAVDSQGNIVNARTTAPSARGTFGAILAGAVLGALHGATAARPGGIPSRELGGGFGAGAEASERFFQQRDLLRRQQAQQNFQNVTQTKRLSQEEAESRARIINISAISAHQIQDTKFAAEDHPLIQRLRELQLDKTADELVTEQQTMLTNQLQIASTLAENGADPTVLGSWGQANEYRSEIGTGKAVVVPNGKSGEEQAGHLFNVPDLAQPTIKDATVYTWTPDKNGKPVEHKQILKAGSVTGLQYLTAAMNGQGQYQRIYSRQKVNAALEAQKAETTKSQAQATQARAEAYRAGEQGKLAAAQVKMMAEGFIEPGNYTATTEDWKMTPEQLLKKMTDQGAKLSPLIRENLPALLALADYTAAPNTFPARTFNRPGQIPQVALQNAINFVKTVRPNWDERTWKATQGLVDSFASTDRNKAGGRLASFDAATRHLGMAIKAGVALDNHDYPLFNDLKNRLAQATGQPAPQNFDGIKQVLVGEVGFLLTGKAITDEEAQQLNNTISRAQSPQQLAGIARTYAHAMLAKDSAQIDQFIAWTGKLPPNYLSPATVDVYRSMGIDIGAELGIPPGVELFSTGNRIGAGQVSPTGTTGTQGEQLRFNNRIIVRNPAMGNHWVYADPQGKPTNELAQ